jgi:nitrite reductase (NADH) small subunit
MDEQKHTAADRRGFIRAAVGLAGGAAIMNIAVFRTAADAVFALEDKCPHKGGPLSQGIVSGHSVTCPLHGWIVGLETGEACAPDQGCTRRLPVRVDGGEVMLGLAQAGSGSAFRA